MPKQAPSASRAGSFRLFGIFLFLIVFGCIPAYSEDSVVGKVIASYIRESRTVLILETKVPLVSGASVYVGEGARAIVDDKLASNVPPANPQAESPIPGENAGDKGSITLPNQNLPPTAFYYGATLVKKEDIPLGSVVRTEAPVAPSFLQVKMEEHYTFEPKRYATVTARQGDRVMINKGSLNEVNDRDIYRITGSDGRYKGLIEMSGVGDFQSSGVLYNRMEDMHRDALKTGVGDKLEFIGQRKLFGLGLMAGIRSSQEMVEDTRESTYGGGLLWNITSRDGWGIEVLFGGFFRDGEGLKNNVRDIRSAKFVAPTWIKKNFFYPSVVSPFLGAGIALFTGTNHYQDYNLNIDQTSGSTTISPVIGGGIEFFSGRFFRPRIEVRYIKGPRLNAGGNTFNNESIFYSAGFLTTW